MSRESFGARSLPNEEDPAFSPRKRLRERMARTKAAWKRPNIIVKGEVQEDDLYVEPKGDVKEERADESVLVAPEPIAPPPDIDPEETPLQDEDIEDIAQDVETFLQHGIPLPEVQQSPRRKPRGAGRKPLPPLPPEPPPTAIIKATPPEVFEAEFIDDDTEEGEEGEAADLSEEPVQRVEVVDQQSYADPSIFEGSVFDPNREPREVPLESGIFKVPSATEQAAAEAAEREAIKESVAQASRLAPAEIATLQKKRKKWQEMVERAHGGDSVSAADVEAARQKINKVDTTLAYQDALDAQERHRRDVAAREAAVRETREALEAMNAKIEAEKEHLDAVKARLEELRAQEEAATRALQDRLELQKEWAPDALKDIEEQSTAKTVKTLQEQQKKLEHDLSEKTQDLEDQTARATSLREKVQRDEKAHQAATERADRSTEDAVRLSLALSGLAAVSLSERPRRQAVAESSSRRSRQEAPVAPVAAAPEPPTPWMRAKRAGGVVGWTLAISGAVVFGTASFAARLPETLLKNLYQLTMNPSAFFKRVGSHWSDDVKNSGVMLGPLAWAKWMLIGDPRKGKKDKINGKGSKKISK